MRRAAWTACASSLSLVSTWCSLIASITSSGMPQACATWIPHWAWLKPNSSISAATGAQPVRLRRITSA